jgi:hypothetical protein
VQKEVYAPWEIRNGFNSDRFLRNEPSRAGEFEIKRRPAALPRDPNLLSRTQWKLRDRTVVVSDHYAKSVVATRNGHHLCLFDKTQTVSL